MIWNMIWKIYIFISQPILYHCCCFCWSKPLPSLGLLKQCPLHSIAHFCPCLVIPLLTIVQWLPISPRVKVKALTRTYKAVCCVPLFPFASSPFILRFHDSISAIQPFWLILQHSRYVSSTKNVSFFSPILFKITQMSFVRVFYPRVQIISYLPPMSHPLQCLALHVFLALFHFFSHNT